ncbi:NADP-dependent oxidoreductase domain-containing protein [Trichoderma chlorosporum]
MDNLQTRPLGRNGPQVSVIGFGAMGLSGFYGPVESEEQRLAFLDEIYKLGERFWDTADIYEDSEVLIGKWLQRSGHRSDVFIATKFGQSKEGIHAIRSDPEYVHSACERSLQRLGLKQIDLFYCHRLDRKTPIEETVKAMVQLKDAGKIKYLGFCEISATSLRRAFAVHPITAVQVEYSPFSLDIETNDLLQTARELGVAVVAYSPLSRGLLTTRYQSLADFSEDDTRRYGPRFSLDNFPCNLEISSSLAIISTQKGCTLAQLTLAWLLAQGEDIFPIPGTKSLKYLRENIEAAGVTLSEEECKKIRDIVTKGVVQGARYPEDRSAVLFANSPLPNLSS